MPDTTGSFPMPYPNSGVAPDGPAAILDLAQAVDDALTNEIQPELDAVGLVWLKTLAATGTDVVIDGLPTDYTGFRIDLIGRSASGVGLTAVLRTAAPADVTTNYDRTELLGRNGAASSGTLATQSSWTLAGFSNTRHFHRLDVEGLCQAVETIVLHDGGVHSDPAVQNSANGRYGLFLTHQDATIYRGLKFVFSSSTAYVCRVYGKR